MRVERRAQLVRHVGEELGLVLRGERQLGGLLLERAAGLLDLLVLALDFDVLLGELLRLLRQLLVGLLQLALPRLQLDGQLLRLLAAGPRSASSLRCVLSTMPMLAVSCSRNVRCDGVKALSDASSITALIWPSKSTGSTTTLRGMALEQPGADRHGVLRDLGDEHAPALDGALPDQALARREPRWDDRASSSSAKEERSLRPVLAFRPSDK